MLRVSSSCLRSLGFSSSPLLSGVAAAAARSKFAFPVPLVLRRGYADDSFKSLLDEISASITKPTSSASSSSIKDSSNENKPSSQQWNRPRNGSASTERQQRYDDDYQSNDVEENERPRDRYRSEGGGYGDGGRRGSRGRGGYEDSRGSRYDGDSQGGYNGNSRGGRRGYEREEGYNETRGGYGRSRDYGDSRGSRGDYGGSRGGSRGDYGGREGRGGEGGRRGPMEFNNSKLEEVDWKQVELTPLNKNYYEEHEAVKGTTELDLHKWRLQHSITVKGSGCPNPVLSFEHTSFPPEIIQCLTSHYEAPTPIQAQGWPVALSGRDMVGSSQTGSGKTLGFILPALVHIKAQLQVQPHRWSDGPIAVVLVPTRELALQVLDESHEYIRKLNLKAVAAYGGSPRGAQANALRQGVHLVVATPGRLIDFLQEGTTNLRRATYVVLDEADRMLDMGFEPQIRQIMTQMRPDRQTLMWSATWPMKVQALAYEFFNDPLTIHVGSTELRANPNVTQKVHVVPEREKHQRATDLIKEIHKTGPVKTLVFCATQEGADRLCWALQTDGFRNTAAIHGGKAQGLRMQMLSSFRDGKLSILVATDVAARGLDINNIQHVINYDFPNEIEDYIHRIGRTGRAGRTGTAHTFLSHENNPGKQVSHLIKVLRDAGQEVTDELRALGVSSFGGGGGGYGRPRQRRFIGRR